MTQIISDFIDNLPNNLEDKRSEITHSSRHQVNYGAGLLLNKVKKKLGVKSIQNKF